jgi:hypothetical protein
VPTIVPSDIVLCSGARHRGCAPDGVLATFEVIAEGLPSDKPQDDLINQLIQIEDERDRLDQFEMIALVALLIVVC